MWASLLEVYLILLVGVSIIGLLRFNILDTPTRIISILIAITAISETFAHILSITTGNNLIVYHIYNPIQFLLVSLYLSSTTTILRKNNKGISIGITGVIISILNSAYLQSPQDDFNSNFLIVESILIIGMTLIYFYDFLNREQTSKNITSIDFWISCLLLVFWSFTFFNWLAEATMPKVIAANIEWVRYLNWVINMITYGGIGYLLLFYKKASSDG